MIIFLNFVLFEDRNNPFERPRGIDLGASCRYCRYLIIVLNNPIVVFLIIFSAKVRNFHDFSKHLGQNILFLQKSLRICIFCSTFAPIFDYSLWRSA